MRVVAVFDDLLLGSNVLGMLRAAGHEARLTGDAADVNPDGAAVLIVDLASPGFDGVAVVEALRAGGDLGDTRTLGVYSHVDAATIIAQVNGQPYSNHDWHWRILVAHQFGHAAAAPAVHGTLRLLDEMGIRGELKLRDYRTGRVETTQMWGRPESVRQEFRRIRQQ